MAAIELADGAGVVIDGTHVGVNLQVGADALGHRHQAVVVALEWKHGYFDRCEMWLEVQHRAIELVDDGLRHATQFFADLDAVGTGQRQHRLDLWQTHAQLGTDGVGLADDGVTLLGAEFFAPTDGLLVGVEGCLDCLELVGGGFLHHLLVVRLGQDCEEAAADTGRRFDDIGHHVPVVGLVVVVQLGDAVAVDADFGADVEVLLVA